MTAVAAADIDDVCAALDRDLAGLDPEDILAGLPAEVPLPSPPA